MLATARIEEPIDRLAVIVDPGEVRRIREANPKHPTVEVALTFVEEQGDVVVPSAISDVSPESANLRPRTYDEQGRYIHRAGPGNWIRLEDPRYEWLELRFSADPAVQGSW